MTADAQTTLDAKTTRYPQQVNLAVSFSAIKHRTLAASRSGARGRNPEIG